MRMMMMGAMVCAKRRLGDIAPIHMNNDMAIAPSSEKAATNVKKFDA